MSSDIRLWAKLWLEVIDCERHTWHLVNRLASQIRACVFVYVDSAASRATVTTVPCRQKQHKRTDDFCFLWQRFWQIWERIRVLAVVTDVFIKLLMYRLLGHNCIVIMYLILVCVVSSSSLLRQCGQLSSDILVLKLISVLVFILFSSQNFYFIYF